MDRRNPGFKIATAPRKVRRQWVRNAYRAWKHNNVADRPSRPAFSLQDAWQTWDPADCGPQTWGRLTERNGIRCAG